MNDKLSNGISCGFFNFKGQWELEAKIRKLIGEALDICDSTQEATIKTIEIFKANGIEKVVWSYDGHALFWYIGD